MPQCSLFLFWPEFNTQKEWNSFFLGQSLTGSGARFAPAISVSRKDPQASQTSANAETDEGEAYADE